MNRMLHEGGKKQKQKLCLEAVRVFKQRLNDHLEDIEGNRPAIGNQCGLLSLRPGSK